MNLFTVIGFANSNDINEEITTSSSNYELIPMTAAKSGKCDVVVIDELPANKLVK